MIAKSAAEVDSPLDAEAWASHLLGTFHEQRYGLPFPDAVEVDAALLFGEPLVTRLATFDDPAARVALASIAVLDDGGLGVLATELLSGSTSVGGIPGWIEQIGESEVVGAAVMSEAVFDDARTVLLETRHPDGETMAVGVLMFVPKLTPADIEDLFVLRIALESEAVRRLVAASASVEPLLAVQEEMDSLVGDEPWDHVTEMDLRFHRTLVEAVGSPRMARAFSAMQSELALLIAQVEYQYPHPHQLGAEHRLVVDAVLSEDADRAVAAIRAHLEEGAVAIVKATAVGIERRALARQSDAAVA
jgi:hypothetical protein